jgi:molybdopterin synthase catalytic subunit
MDNLLPKNFVFFWLSALCSYGSNCVYRSQSFKDLEWIVEAIKKEVPIWKKENFEDGNHEWIGGK